MGFHNLRNFEKFRERCKESGSDAERPDAYLKNSLIFDGKTGHSEIGSACDGTN
jgi:hypothetical protein